MKSCFRFTIFVMVLILSISAKLNCMEKHASPDTIRYNFGNRDGTVIKVKVKGETELAEDDSDILRLSEQGYLSIKEIRGDEIRIYLVRKSKNGEFEKRYFLQGILERINATARQWISEVLRKVTRRTGLGANTRIARMLERGGLQSVLDEIAIVENDWLGKRVYYETLLKNEALKKREVSRILQQAVQEITHDNRKAELLINLIDLVQNNLNLISTYFNAVNSIVSSNNRYAVLIELLENANTDKAILLEILVSASALPSSSYRADFLEKASVYYKNDADLQMAYHKITESLHFESALKTKKGK